MSEQTKKTPSAQEQREAAFAQAIRDGGARLSLQGSANIYDARPDPKVVKEDPASREAAPRALLKEQIAHSVGVRPILSPSIKLSARLRAVGNFYGASVEQGQIGLSGEFLPEVVDGGKGATGGISPHLAEIRHRVLVANAALRQLPDITHRAAPKMVDGQQVVGPHGTITPHLLVAGVCAYGVTITEIALRAGWWKLARDKDGQGWRHTLPKQQSQKLKAALENALTAIDDAWIAIGIDAWRYCGGVDVG